MIRGKFSAFSVTHILHKTNFTQKQTYAVVK